MHIDHSIANITVADSLTDALNSLRRDVVILSGLDTWESPIYTSEAVFLAKFMRVENIDCSYLHATEEREFEAKYSAEHEAITNVVLAILNSDVLSAVVRCLETLIHRSRIPALRIQFIYRKSADGDEFTCLQAEGNADSVIKAVREVVCNVQSEQGEK